VTSTDITVKLFVCVELIPLGHVSESGTTLNVLHIWIGWSKSWWKTYRSCVLLTQMILEKNEKGITLHFERMIKVKCGCVRK